MWRARISARSARLALAALCLSGAAVTTVAEATAQGWWPWSQSEPRPVPREPLRQPPPYGPQPQQPMGQAGPHGSRGPTNLCLQLEQRLVSEVQGQGQGGRELLPRIEQDMRELDRTIRSTSIQLDRSDCWDQFLFSKTLRRNRRCVDLNSQIESSRHRLADLDRQRRQIMGTGERSSMRDDIIRELARNGCGQQYVQEARKREHSQNPLAMLFGEEDDAPRGPINQFGNLPFATYRTVCVRLCDGYYFPVSFSTLPNHFQRDAQQCQSQCAAPAELFYHQNPGGAVEQMVSVSGQPYTSLKTAFRYRKEFVQGCSCKQAEYSPAVGKKAEVTPPPQSQPQLKFRLGATDSK